MLNDYNDGDDVDEHFNTIKHQNIIIIIIQIYLFIWVLQLGKSRFGHFFLGLLDLIQF